MKVFISGPMKGLPNWNVDAFNEMEAKLKEAGYDVFNPAWLQFTPGWEHEEIIKIDFAALALCDVMIQLPGWENSRGASEENEEAKRLYIPIVSRIEDIEDHSNDPKYEIDDLIEKDKNGELEPGVYYTSDCPVCKSKEHGGMVRKEENGDFKSFTENEECAKKQQSDIDIANIFSNIKFETPLDENGNPIDVPFEEIKEEIVNGIEDNSSSEE